MFDWNKNPFREFRAEQIDIELWKLYVPLPFDQLLAPRPLVLEGGRGSGKTMFFICNSWKERIQTIDQQGGNMNDLLIPPESVGIYYRVDTEFTQSMEGRNRSDWDRIFSSYLAVCFAKEIFTFLLEAVASGIVEDQDLYETFSVIKTLINNAMPINSLEQAINACDFILDEIQSIPDRPLNHHSSINFSTTGRFILKIVDNLRTLTPFVKTVFRFYIDEYETLLIYQQQIVNTLIKHSSFYIIYNIGMRPNGMQTSKTIGPSVCIEPPHDFNHIRLENLLIPEDKKNNSNKIYQDVIKEICRRRFEIFAIKNNFENIPIDITWYLGEYDIDWEIENITQNASDNTVVEELKGLIEKFTLEKAKAEEYINLLAINAKPENSRLHLCLLKRSERYRPSVEGLVKEYKNWLQGSSKSYQEWYNHTKLGIVFLLAKEYGKAKFYYGLDVYTMLSSGIIRYFLELCEKAFDSALQNGFDWNNPRPISPMEQTLSARYVSRYKINNIIQYEPYGKNLRIFVQNFGEICQQLHQGKNITLGEPEPNHFSTDHFKLDDNTQAILKSGVFWAVIQDRESSKDKDSLLPVEFYEYHLNHIYCPYFGISYRKKHKLELQPEVIINLLSGNDEIAKATSKSYLNKFNATFEQATLFGGKNFD